MGAITDVSGIKVGNAQDLSGITGITVVVCKDGATASVQVLGGAPGTRETDLLRTSYTVSTVHAVFLAGGSAFGLNAADGVVRYLEEQGVGFDTGIARVPIVPGAVIFDLGIGNPAARPTAEMAYRACVNASSDPPESGNAGAGTGATVGKGFGPQYCMKSGLGTSSIRTPTGHTVGALLSLNALGDIYDPASGRIVAGAYDRGRGAFLAELHLPHHRTNGANRINGANEANGVNKANEANKVNEANKANGVNGGEPALRLGQNTTIGVVATDCALSKEECERIALMAMGGLAQAVRPSFTPFDGDTLFVLSTGKGSALPPATAGLRPRLVAEIGMAAQVAVVQAVLDAVRSAKSMAGIPSLSDIAVLTRS